MKKILIVSHVFMRDGIETHGPLHSIVDYLKKSKRHHLIVSYPLYSKIPLPIKSVLETLNTIKFGFSKRFDIIIAIDPLNALAGIILKKLGRCKSLIFYTVDYADKRFENSFLNSIYHLIDRLAINNADYVWNVSSRIVQKRLKQGIKKEKIILLPNSPDVEQIKPAGDKEVNRNWILMISGVTHSPTFDATVNAFLKVVKRRKDAKLLIAGSGPYEAELKKIAKSKGLKNNIEFKGQMQHKDLVTLMRKCGIGIALYTQDFSWTKYGDSMKAREYLAAGVPTIITGTVSTADDIRKAEAGIVVKLDEKEIANVIDKILSNEDLYKKMRINARNLALATDFAAILETSLAKIGVEN
ncbi:MAG: glycosyltransferase [Patescibacteria group bacterium]